MAQAGNMATVHPATPPKPQEQSRGLYGAPGSDEGDAIQCSNAVLLCVKNSVMRMSAGEDATRLGSRCFGWLGIDEWMHDAGFFSRAQG